MRTVAESGLSVVSEDRNPYDVLGVSRTATQTEIAAAYKRLIRQTHPDAGGTNHLFREVQESFEILSDPSRRAAYDKSGGRRPAEDSEPPPTSGWRRTDSPGPPPGSGGTGGPSGYRPPPGGPYGGPNTGTGPPPPRSGPTGGPSDYRPPRGGPYSSPNAGPGPGTPPPWSGGTAGQRSQAPPAMKNLPAWTEFWTQRPWLIAIVAGGTLLLIGSRVPALAGLGFLTLVVGLIAWVGSRRVRRYGAFRRGHINEVDYMDGTTFEIYLADILRANGYQVKHVGQPGDFGADLVISGAGGSAVVQAKRYGGNVGPSAVQEAAAARAHYGTERAIVLTNSYFTDGARSLAHSNHVELWDRNKLVQLVSGNGTAPLDAAPALLLKEVVAGVTAIGGFLLILATNSGRGNRRRRPGRRRHW